ncbi:hypothetical protein VCHENC02_1926A, partial [Vibrio harveyi]
MTSFE